MARRPTSSSRKKPSSQAAVVAPSIASAAPGSFHRLATCARQRQFRIEPQVGQRALQIPEQRERRARHVDLRVVEHDAQDTFAERRRLDHQFAARRDRARRARHALPALKTRQARIQHVDAVFACDVGQHGLPMHDVLEFAPGAEAAPRRGARHDDHARALERRHGRSDGVPRIFADQDRGRPKSTREDAEFPPARVKALLIEHAVRRQEQLAVHVRDLRLRTAEPDVERAIVERAAVVFEESADDVDRPAVARPPNAVQIGGERRRRKRELVHRAFEEVSRQRRLGEHDQIGRRLAQLREDRAERGEVARVVTLARFELDQRDLRHVAIASDGSRLAASIAAINSSAG